MHNIVLAADAICRFCREEEETPLRGVPLREPGEDELPLTKAINLIEMANLEGAL